MNSVVDLEKNPTAVHTLGEVHDTPNRPLSVEPTGLGVGWTDHLWPFQRSASVKYSRALVPKPPTAVHAEADVHDTPNRVSSVEPMGWGVGWIDHFLPFQRSASMDSLRAPFPKPPTAMHALADAHDTPEKPFSVEPVGLRVS
jgi:hypothetical protein